MTQLQQLTTFGLAARLTADSALVGFCLWALLGDLGKGDLGWAALDSTVLTLCAWRMFADVHNWKDRRPRFTLVKRPKS
jgi:hypothetical protein